MLASTLLVVSLWQAANTAGDRVPVCVPGIALPGCVDGRLVPLVPAEDIADDFIRDVYWVVGANSADLFSTAWMLYKCKDCYEANPLGVAGPEARIALKMASMASTTLTLWKLRRDGHKNWARGLRIGVVVGHGVIAAWNTRLALRGRK